MTRPTSTPPGWGSGIPGIPGIPSIWETPSAPSAAPPHARRGRPPRPPLRPWVIGSLTLTSLLLLTGLISAGDDLTVGGDSTSVALPPLPPPGPGPVAVPLPPPPAPGPVVEPLPGLAATRVDGSGDVFGLPLGEAALLRDPGGGAVEVTAVAARQQGADLLIDLRLSSTTDAGVIGAVPVDVPVLRLSDGSELPAGVLGADGSGFPATLAPGQRWDGTLVFPAPGQPGALVLLHAGRALAGWTVPLG